MNTLLDIFRKYLSVLVVSGIIFLTLVLILRFALPKIEEIQALRTEIQEKSTERDEKSTYLSYLNELSTKTLEVEETLVNYALPSENDVVSLIVTITGLSKFEGITVAPFELEPGLIRQEKKDNKVEKVNTTVENTDPLTPNILLFEMNAETVDNQKAFDFINEIRKTRRIFDIQELTWSKEPGVSQSELKISLSFKLGTYYYLTAPTKKGSRDLVIEGKEQETFINNLKDTIQYDDLILDSVPVGKLNLFSKETVATKEAGITE